MITKILTNTAEGIETAAEYIKSGKTVVFPTETVYGLGANALDENAVKKIFEAKGRPSDNPLIVHISSIEMLDDIAENISDDAKKLMDKFWPGPLTLIFKKKANIPNNVTAGLSTVAVRFPSSNTAYELIEKAGVPIAAPSANLSGKPSPTRFSHSYEDLNGRVDAMIKGESCEVGVESTVLDVSGDTPVLLRPGKITLEKIQTLLGEVVVGSSELSDSQTPMSPGMKYKHYAPKAEVIILKGSKPRIKEYIKNEIDEKLNESAEKKISVLTFKENVAEFSDLCTTVSFGSLTDSSEVMSNLFNSLRELDDMDVDIIYAPEISDIGEWRAVQNRLYKAAGGNIIDLNEAAVTAQAEKISESADIAAEVNENPNTEIIDEEKAENNSEEEFKTILFICTGNTCRSPMAEGIFNAEAEKEGIPFRASSAGTYAYNNLPVSENSEKAMREIGLDISKHKSRQITRTMLSQADLILTMTEEHTEFLNTVASEHSKKIMTVAKYIDLDISVEDPYGNNLDEYIRCRNQLQKIIKLIIMKLKKNGGC